MEKPKEDLLVELKECYDNGQVSALVGAGFSKNVSNLFLSWEELLHDMISNLYEIEINKNYDNYILQNKGKRTKLKKEEEIRNEYIQEIYHNSDSLEIVSKYIKKNEFRECVECYIEDRIPYVVINKEGKIVLKKGGKECEEISESNFSAHKELLLLKRLKNIYTTNYENLLEFSVDLLKKELSLNEIELVVDSQGLSDKGHCQKIIKIHGNLRKSTKEKIQFDGDNSLCYIIATEDYDSYMEKHEAFTEKMRMAMLEGKFMLVGFSGTDKNYKGWVKWVKNILDKEPKNTTKIYIVDVSGKPISQELEYYYNNNNISVINLINQERLAYIGFKDDEIKNLLKHELKNEDKRNILTVFLRYLNTKAVKIDDSFENSDNNESSGLKNSSILHKVKPNAHAYRKLWNEAYSKSINIEDVDDIARKIIKGKTINRFPKYIYNQDSIIDHVIRKPKLNHTDALLLSMAIDECGLNPYYYSKVILDYEELDKLPLWNLLKVKEKTFNGVDTKMTGKDDNIIYENIQRLLFHLEFKKANYNVKRWKPCGIFIIAKAMRLASIKGQKEKAFDLLANYIKEEDNPSFQLYAMQIANYISNMYPRPYNTDDFYQYGIDGIGDNLDFMIQQLRGKLKEPRARGWIGSTMDFGGSNPEYEKSLRILRFISDIGLYLNFGSTYFMDKASWYLVFKNLYNEFPYPCFFYSIQYNDNNLQTRIGQDFAYSPKLYDFNKDILVKAIKAYDDDNTPQIFLTGILNVIAPMYTAVDESLWFDIFKDHLFRRLIENFDKLDLYNALVKNIKNALVSLKNPQNIIYVLGELLNHYRENHALADSFIRANLEIKYIKEHVHKDIWTSLKELIASYPEIDITELIFFMEENEVMTKEIKDAFIERITKSKEDQLPQGRSSSIFLCLLTRKYPKALEISKRLLLKHNVWHCGVMADGKGWSTPNYIRLNIFNNEINWTDEEFEIISINLKENISKYNQLHKNLHEDSFTRNIQVEYLSDVIRFIDGLNEERKTSLEDIREKAESLLNSCISYKSLIEGMLSEQSADADFAMDNVIQGIKAEGLSKYLDEFNFILDRAIMGDDLVINAVLHKIRIVVEKYPEQVKSANLCSKLHTMISIYKERWMTYLEFKPVWSFNNLYVIANFLKKNGFEESESIKYWLTDSFVMKFIRL